MIVPSEPVEPQAPFDKLIKQLAIRLGRQKTTPKSLVIRANGWRGHTRRFYLRLKLPKDTGLSVYAQEQLVIEWPQAHKTFFGFIKLFGSNICLMLFINSISSALL